MLAAILLEPNRPLELRSVADPVPGGGQVLVRVSACGVCGTDVHAHRGRLRLELPMTLGHEIVGVVEQLGPGVVALRVGDRVAVPWVQVGCGRCVPCMKHRHSSCRYNRCWTQNGGGFAELVVADAAGCTPIPSGLSFEQAAALVCAGYAAMSGYRSATPRPGERVAVIGIGGLGHLALQLAKAMGHEVVAITATVDKVADARRFGADHVIAGSDRPGEELHSIGGADVILSTSNSMTQNGLALQGLRPFGRYVSMAAGECMKVDPMLLMAQQISIRGSRRRLREDLVDMLGLAVRGKVEAEVELQPLGEVNDALARLAAGKTRYRAVLTPGRVGQ